MRLLINVTQTLYFLLNLVKFSLDKHVLCKLEKWEISAYRDYWDNYIGDTKVLVLLMMDLIDLFKKIIKKKY